MHAALSCIILNKEVRTIQRETTA